MNVPLAHLIRPKSLDEIVGQKHLLGRDKPLRKLVENDLLSSAIFFGPAGIGKTTLANIISLTTKSKFVSLNATSLKIPEVRKIIESYGERQLIYMEEVYRLTRAQQDVFLPYIEEGKIIFVGSSTENPYHNLSSPLLSRCYVFQFEPLSIVDLGRLLIKAVDYYIKNGRKINFDVDAARHLINMSCGDGRKVVSLVELCVVLCEGDRVGLDFAREICPSKYVIYTDDMKYDYASAFQGSIQASDVDSAIYWLAAWLESGEDPRYIARRIVVSASEDCYSTPEAAVIASNAYLAACHIGRPECDLVLAHATAFMATAKRDKSAAKAIWAALKDVREGVDVAVPKEMRDMHYEGSAQLGNGAYHDGMNQEKYVGVNKKYFKTPNVE